MVKALADRLAEALAELLHEKTRRQIWGYSKDEDINPEDLLKVKVGAPELHDDHDCTYSTLAFDPPRATQRSRTTLRRRPCGECWAPRQPASS